MLRRVVASGNWSNPSTWENGILPQVGDDVEHDSPFIVVLDITPPSLGQYTLNGLLLLPSSGGVSLSVANMSGSGSLDLQSLTNPQGAEINPCVIQATSGALDFTNFSSLFPYYNDIFYLTKHGQWWKTINPAELNFVLPKIVSSTPSGSDLILTISTDDNTPARRVVQNYLGRTTSALIPIGGSINDISLSRFSVVVNTLTEVVVVGGAGLAGKVPSNSFLAFTEHTALCPIVLRNAHLRGATSLHGLCISDGCFSDDVVYLSSCCVRSPLDMDANGAMIVAPRNSLNRRFFSFRGLVVWAAEG